ncbi:hypothetical protein AUC70_06005 [Methyloceanibacter stevinii]|uniref:Rieske domain-containing protein n=1 Tax=Methyloceanibacter stevinii TaxID=1774970 RepID=A0A1E3VQL3_9HYPH|nr:ubiquinol-cytochrome c reductase iron-sulfur subunit [Methyloceanibacter stevinii]ODR95246.1 hypothetical protein AUC70_06005 [Methyloceanibacter stevinii]
MAIPALPSALANAALDAASMRPQPGDLLVFMIGENQGETIAPSQVEVGARPILAYPMDPVTKTLRDGSRFNIIAVGRLDPSEIEDDTKPLSADGVVAYSAVCTHNGCIITENNDTHHEFVCNCHGSTFDVGNKGKIVVGPATRRLAILPLKLADGNVTVAADFDGRLGPPRE